MELLASINSPTCSGRFVWAEKFVICRGGRLLSVILNWSCFRSRTNLPSLSTTVKTTFTSSVRTRTVGILPLSGAACCWALAAGIGVDAGGCATVTQANAIQRNKDCLRIIECCLCPHYSCKLVARLSPEGRKYSGLERQE